MCCSRKLYAATVVATGKIPRSFLDMAQAWEQENLVNNQTGR